MTLPEKVKKLINEYDMIREGDNIVVGVSGGADSVCLFHVLRMLREEMDFSMRVVHVHHMIRGEEADRDAAFVEALCGEAGTAFVLKKYDVPAYASRMGMSVEEAGRVLRREAFAEEAAKTPGSKIALAHHMNDLAETVLFNMARGSGIAGLASLRPVRGMYIRPLLRLERYEIERWMDENGFDCCIDSTNADNAYSRNRIRQMVLPELADHVNRRSVRHICETSEEAAMIEEWLSECVDECLGRYTRAGSDGEIILDAELFSKERDLIAGRTVKAVIGRLSGTVKDIGRAHVRAICELSRKENGKRVNLPYGIYAESVYGQIHLVKARTADVNRDEDTCTGRNTIDRDFSGKAGTTSKCVEIVPGRENIIEFGEICVRAALSGPEDIAADSGKTENVCTKKFDYDKINGILKIRYRMAGDYLVINPDGRRKSLSDYFTDRKIPRSKRDKIPLLTCGAEVLWVIGYRTGESCRIDEKTKKILHMNITQNGGLYG